MMVHTIAKYLLKNFEEVKSSYLDGKIALIYFLFNYAETYRKEAYMKEAFNFLVSILSEEFSYASHNFKSSNYRTAGLGWSLIIFMKKRFFESEDLDYILLSLDEKIFFSVESLSRGKFSPFTMKYLTEHGSYLDERIKLLENDQEYYITTQEVLLITFFELSENVILLDKKDYRSIAIYKCTFLNSINNEFVKHFCVKGLEYIETLTAESEEKKILEEYYSFLKREDFEYLLLLNYLFSDKISVISHNKKRLISWMKSDLRCILNSLIDNNHSKNRDQLISKLLTYSICIYGDMNDEIDCTLLLNLINERRKHEDLSC